MKWFVGSIADAIAEAKNVNGIFIVYIYDNSEASKSARQTLDSESVTSVLSSSKYIAINIENGSNDAIQFAQIYPVIVIPSLFFISGQTGVPLEVVGGNFNRTMLLEKLEKLHLHRDQALQDRENENTAEVSYHETAESDLPLESVIDTENLNDQNTQRQDGILPEEACAYAVPAANEVTSDPVLRQRLPLSLDDKISKARSMIAETQEIKNMEKMEEGKKNELERRRQLSDLTRAKQRREDLEREDICNQRRKDKEDNRIAIDRVRAQIVADRAERQAREALLKGTDPPHQQPLQHPDMPVAGPSSSKKRDGTTKIKFRFTDNSSDLGQFSSTATLKDVKNYLKQNVSCPHKHFSLVATLPHRTFTEDEDNLTLEELKLSPSAILIVKPVSSRSAISILQPGVGIFDIFWAVLTPLTLLLNYLKNIMGFGEKKITSSELSDEEESQVGSRHKSEDLHPTRHRPKTAYGTRQGSQMRKEGNIYRFNRATDDDDDDDNNTWNGNSTQQM